ncbi:OPT/YSL family transporter [Acanthopleuribacter pedis]
MKSAVGVYLPLSTRAAVFAGGLVRHLVCRKQKEEESERRREQGTLFASGLVGGEGLTGVLLADTIVFSNTENLKSIGFGIIYGPVVAVIVTSLGILAPAICNFGRQTVASTKGIAGIGRGPGCF